MLIFGNVTGSSEILVFHPEDFEKITTKFPYNSKVQPHNIHIGQRKLLLNEIFFLTKYGHLSDTVVYAGAAHGTNIPIVSELFPNHKFILYDPGNFAIKPTDKIEINTGDDGWFTNDVAKKYADDKVLFISDIRSRDDDVVKQEAAVIENNNQQMEWIKIMNPVATMLKFRLSFHLKEAYKYFAGKIDLQPWGPSTTETRLIVTDNSSLKPYLLSEYESKMFYVNNILRAKTHDYDVSEVSSLKEPVNWDTAYEVYIWEQYYDKYPTSESKKEFITNIMNKTTKVIDRDLFGRHLKK